MADERRLTLQQVADELGVHYMTAYRYVRLGMLDATKEGNSWRIERSDLDAFVGVDPANLNVAGADWSARLEARMIVGDQTGSAQVVSSALMAGREPVDIHLEVIAPAMRRIGERWESGELTVAQEHQAVAVATRLLGQLGPRFNRSGRSLGVVVLGAVTGDFHSLPVTIVADTLRGARFDVLDLGANVPADAFAEVAAGQTRLVAVGVSASAPDPDPIVRDTIKHIRSVVDAPILLGGVAIADETSALKLGADGYADDALGAVERLAALVDGQSAPITDTP